MPRKLESTPLRENRRRYEERNKEKRRLANCNFQTMIPREDYEVINAFLKEHNISKVQFIKESYLLMLDKLNKEK